MNKTIATVLLALLVWPLHQIGAAEIALPEIGDSAGALISPQEEYRIGQAFYWRIQQSTDLIDDPEINSYLQSIGYRLVANSSAPNLPFTFFMVPASSVNAFAAPGGFIGTHSGLILTSQSEDELASVLAHEIAHITQRHLLRSFEKQKRMSVPRTAALIAAVLLGAADPKAGSAAVAVVQAAGVQQQLDFTRAHEKEADNLGMVNLVRSGFDAHAMPSFFERLNKESRFYTGNAVPEFLRTHPVTTSRIADARGRAESYPLQRQLSDTLQFYLMREKLRVMTTNNVRELVQQYEQALKTGNSRNSTATQYGYSLALSEMGEYTKAREALQALLEQDDDRLSYQLAMAEIEITVGRLPAALAIYEENQRLYPDDQALSLLQVTALLQAHLPNEAIAVLQRQLDLGHPSQRLYKLLAQARGDLGDKSQSHSWLAEYYYASGRLAQAGDQLRLAAKFANRDEYLLAKITARLREVETTLALMEEI
ncbi:MAG: M48 family metallopeptidase [Proteobacteria bacterium]|nr:M48 family metallopeptidase [Pseudomonadota bacterium]